MRGASDLLLPLREARAIESAGGKAINLAQLLQAGLPVPEGWVVTTRADRSAPDGRVSASLAEELASALGPFEGRRFAVRSSATAEDLAGASMAGQYESYLNLETIAEITEAIEKCWASVRSARSRAYLAEQGLSFEAVEMAVVVQQQVAAEAAGVLFTVDPKSGSRDHMVLEACWGLGEALVSGEVQPDLVRLTRAGHLEVDYRVAPKALALVAGSRDFQAVPAEKQKRACLSFAQVQQLREMGLKAEAHFGSPQDIEWAVQEGQVYFLQSRAITTLAESETFQRLLESTRAGLTQAAEEGRGPWVRHNLGETLPHPTALTWSLLAPFMSGRGGYGKMHEELGFKPGPTVQTASFLERIGGEIYMDCSRMTEMFSPGYPLAYDPVRLRKDPDAAQSSPTLAKGSLKERAQAARLATTVAQRIEELSRDLDHRLEKEWIPAISAWVREQESLALETLSDPELAELWCSQTAKVLDDFGATAFLPSAVEVAAMEELRSVLAEDAWEFDQEETLATLAVSPTADQTLAANLALSHLSQEEWLQSYGHRATAEFELAAPRWSEEEGLFKRLREQVGGTDLEELHQDRLRRAETCLEALQKALPAPAFGRVRAAVERVRRYLRFREDGKFHLIRAYSQLRPTALEVGRRLGLGETVFHLRSEEMLAALESGFVPEDRVALRAREYRVEKRLRLPHVIEADDIPSLGQAPPPASGSALKAHPVSRGAARGPASVVLDPAEADSFPEGGVLVCPSTDPSWTPLFAKAAGLVLERGGSLSHGAIVAREMGLPAVVLEGATQSLQEGEQLTIDAQAGWVHRGQEAPGDPSPQIEASLLPPPPGRKEQARNRAGLGAAVAWGSVLALVFVLPAPWFKDPIYRVFDALIWPLVASIGMVGAVAAVALFFGWVPILLQKFFTDNPRLLEAKRRAGRLRKEAAKHPAGHPLRQRMEKLASAVTGRILKAAMVPLALLLGPMLLIFLWFPTRVDPASWNAEPGRMVSVVAEIAGDSPDLFQLKVDEPLRIPFDQQQRLPALRQELEELRGEWRASSDLSAFPWEVQSAADQTRLTLLSSLDAFLRGKLPSQKLSWLVEVPEEAEGLFPAGLQVDGQTVLDFELALGTRVPPRPAAFAEVSPEVLSLQINYPRRLQKGQFFVLPGTRMDLGWLGVYLLAYLPVIFIAKAVLRVP
ncbi:MAG: PEP/pyruvate-binding domain-containing protein [Verrucomicrobiota bacterium]